MFRISNIISVAIFLIISVKCEISKTSILASGPIMLGYEAVREHVCSRMLLDDFVCEDTKVFGDFFKCSETCNPQDIESRIHEVRTITSCNDTDFDGYQKLEEMFKKKSDQFLKRCVVIERCRAANSGIRMDGLGHYVFKVLKKINREFDHGFVRSYDSFFAEMVRRSALYLKNLKDVGDVYCHKVRADDDPSTYNSTLDYLPLNFICYQVPPLDDWFNIRWLLPSNTINNDPDHYSKCLAVHFEPGACGKNCAKRIRNEFQVNYWKGQKVDKISCGNDAAVSDQFVIAIHLRLGDLLHPPQLEFFQEKLNRIPYYQKRLEHSISGFERALRFVEKSSQRLTDENLLRVIIVSDISFVSDEETREELNRIFRKKLWHDLYLRVIPQSSYYDGFAHHVLVSHKLSHLPVIDFMLDTNPLVGIHCLAKADLMIEPSTSYFGNLAMLFSSGVAVTPGNSASQFHEKNASVSSDSRDIETVYEDWLREKNKLAESSRIV